eukprot:TRINITY_DN9583_c0_g1_i1.p1 TRINITY_DN9583_c0_g1~~TRINITY_DN9583_c0_g1_i1.p1  ORF type:complete len:418 (+),score=50.70 TRINITY_DN9583_c0_g1_i1:40-1293(+)
MDTVNVDLLDENELELDRIAQNKSSGNEHGHGHKNKKSKKSSKKETTTKQFIALSLVGLVTLIYCLGELGIAIYISSLALLSDGFHNLSDVISVGIALWAIKLSKRKKNERMSYGFKRATVLGGLANGCFLLSLCAYIVFDAVPRIIYPQGIEDTTKVIMYIAAAGSGLLVNTVGTIILACAGAAHSHSHSHSHSHDHGHGHEKGHHKKQDREKKKNHKFRDENMWAVFIHYLGDAVSSLFILVAGLLLFFFPHSSWVKYVDPVSSFIIIILIVFTTLPIVYRCSIILLQSAPSSIDLDHIKSRIKSIEGVLGVHDFHVWQLVDEMIIASLHVTCRRSVDVVDLLKSVRKVLHKWGIHSSTIQPEIIEEDQQLSIDSLYQDFCTENCVTGCDSDWCCKTPKMGDKFLRRSEKVIATL